MENRVLKARDSIPQGMEDIVSQLSEKIIDLNRMNQLFMGLNTKGQIIGRYSEATEKQYGGAAKGKFAGDPYNFEDTGAFFKAFTLKFHNGKLDIFSTDSKVPLLQEKYDHLFGLTWEHEMELNYELLKPELLKFIKRIIYNG
jgi:hypothetical protein